MKAVKMGDKIEISFDYDVRLVNIVKSFPGREYNPRRHIWHIPIAGAMSSLKKMDEERFEISEEVRRAVLEDEQKAKQAEILANAEDADFKTDLPLYPYQKAGAAFLINIGSGLLGDDPGLGKTLQTLAVCEETKAGKVLIFCPAAVKWQWFEEIGKFIKNNNNAVVIEGNKAARDVIWKSEARFYIANYELLLRDFDSINVRKWDIILADEATKISNPQAQQSRLIKKLTALRRIAMTGTPISNKANEIWNLCDFISQGSMGNYYAFLNRYCLKNQWGGIFGYQNMDELKEKLKRYMIRRRKIDVLPELPAKIETDIPFELSESEKNLYRRIKKQILEEIDGADIAKVGNHSNMGLTLVKMLRLKQLADSMELLGENKKSSKLEVLKELLSETLANGRKALIFTQFSSMADILERELADYQALKITGKIKEEYNEVVKKFNTNDDNRILILTSAGQYGLNIQSASVIFHYDQEWSIAKMEQRIGRAYRIGQKNTVLVYNLLAKGTVDYYVKKILNQKTELSNQLLGDTPNMEQVKAMLQYEL